MARQLGVGALAAWRPSIAGRQIDIQADFVNHYEIGCRNLGDAQPKRSPCPLVALAGDQTLFFATSPGDESRVPTSRSSGWWRGRYSSAWQLGQTGSGELFELEAQRRELRG
jgi:hypothetical protein